MLKPNKNYHQFNAVRAAEGRRPYTFDLGALDAAGYAFATFKQWQAIGWNICKGATGAKVYSETETGRVTAYTVFSREQVKPGKDGMKPAELDAIITEARINGEQLAARQARKYGERSAEEVARINRDLRGKYEQAAPARKENRQRRAAQKIAQKIAEDFNNVYAALYETADGANLGIDGETYRAAVQDGDALIRENCEILHALAEIRSDVIASDRETAALAILYRAHVDKDTGLLDVLHQYMKTWQAAGNTDAAQGGELDALPLD